jgi:hypothetical protein
MLIYWDFHTGGLFLCPNPFLWGRVSVLSAHPCCQCVMIICCFSILWSSLTLDAVHWLRRWALWSTTCPAYESGLLPTHFCSSSVCLLIVHAEIRSLLLPLSLVHFQLSCPSAVMLDYSLLFVIQFFLGVGVSLPRGCAGLSRGWWGNSMWCVALTCLVCGMSWRQVWSQQRKLR